MKEVDIDGSAFVKADDEKTISGQYFIEVIKTVIGQGSSLRFTAKGYSMTPFIKCGDIITISPLDNRKLLGEVVAFINPENQKLVVHRVIGRNRYGYIIKGDNVFGVDGCVPERNILARVRRVEHKSIAVPLGIGRAGVVIALFGRILPVIPITMIAWRNIRDCARGRTCCAR